MEERRSTQEDEPESQIAKLWNLILADALRRGASEIQMEPCEWEIRILFRIDGILYTVMKPPMKIRDAMTCCIKAMAKLDTSEMRLPQVGSIKRGMNGDGTLRVLEYRVSTNPTPFGEKVVLRLRSSSPPG